MNKTVMLAVAGVVTVAAGLVLWRNMPKIRAAIDDLVEESESMELWASPVNFDESQVNQPE